MFPTVRRSNTLHQSHLSCCGNDEARQDQIDEMMAWIVNNVGILNVYTPIVYAGDLILVGYANIRDVIGRLNFTNANLRPRICQIGPLKS